MLNKLTILLLPFLVNAPVVAAFGLNPELLHRRRNSLSKYPKTRTGTRLQLSLPPAAWWAGGHVLGGTLGTPFVVKSTSTWYRKIDLPSWTPPDRIFAPVWTTLYTCMGVAAAKVHFSRPASKIPMLLWTLHMALNLVWAPVFFGLKRLRLGFWLSLAQVLSLLIIIPVFYVISPISAYLLLPYLVWLTFATALNKAICKRNPTQNGYNDAMLQSDIYKLQQNAAKYAGNES